MEISLRYPPVTGRLHTRYAPVRRSSAEYCYSLLPLDLHVLSLPLAFILSQDQTLHCKNCSLRFSVYRFLFTVRLLPFWLVFVSNPLSCIEGLTHAISNLSSVSNNSVLFRRFLRRKTAAKVQPFSKPPKYFFTFFKKNLHHCWFSVYYGRIFFHHGTKRTEKLESGKGGKEHFRHPGWSGTLMIFVKHCNTQYCIF